MDINLLDRKFEHNSAAAAVANTAATTNSPAPTNPDVIAPATMHPIAKRAELVIPILIINEPNKKHCRVV